MTSDKHSISFLEAIGIVASEQELERVVVRVVDFLKEVGKVSAEQKLIDATQNAIMSLKKWGNPTTQLLQLVTAPLLRIGGAYRLLGA